MKKELLNLFATGIFVLLFSCANEEPKPQPVVAPSFQPTERVAEKKDYSAFHKWFGHYSHFKDGIITNGVSVGMVEYTFDLNDTICLFKGSGYQVYFEYLCEPVISGDTLFLHEQRDVSYDENKPVEKQYHSMLIKKKVGYFLLSDLVFEKLKMKRTAPKE